MQFLGKSPLSSHKVTLDSLMGQNDKNAKQLIFLGLISCHLFSAWKIASSLEVLAVILFQIFVSIGN